MHDWGIIVTLYADGLIGNQRILETLGILTVGTYNQWLPKGKPALKLYDFVPTLKAYHENNDTNDTHAMSGDEMAGNIELFFKMMGA